MTFEHINGLNETEILAAVIRSSYCLLLVLLLLVVLVLYVICKLQQSTTFAAKDVIECGCCVQTQHHTRHSHARSLTHKITLRSIHAFLEPQRASERVSQREGELTEITTIRWME